MLTAVVMPAPVSYGVLAFVVLILFALMLALLWPATRQVRHELGQEGTEPTGPVVLRDETRTDDVGYDATETEWRS